MLQTDRQSQAYTTSRWRAVAATMVNPPILRRIDRHLLLTRPMVWRLRLPQLAYLTLSLYLFVLLLGWFLPVYTPHRMDGYQGIAGGLWAIASCVVLGCWFYLQSQFSVEREHGVQQDRYGLREYAWNVVAIFIVLASASFALLGAKWRIQTAFPPRRLASELVLFHVAADLFEQAEEDAVEALKLDMRNRSLPIPSYIELDDAARRQLVQDTLQELGRILSEGTPFQTLFLNHLSKTHQFQTTSDDNWIANTLTKQFISWNRKHYDPTYHQSLGMALQEGTFDNLYDLMLVYETSIYTRRAFLNHSFIKLETYSFRSIAYDANELQDFGYTETPLFIIAFLSPILLIVALDIALLRFMFQHAGRRTGLQMLGWLIAFGLLAWFIGGMEYEISRWITYYYPEFGKGSQLLGTARYYILPILLFVLIAVGLIMRASKASNQQQYHWSYAIPLYLLPLITIALAYALLMTVEYSAALYGFDDPGFIETIFYKTKIVSFNYSYRTLTAFGTIFFWAFHLIYLPLIPYLKRAYRDLSALPRPS